MRVMKPTRTRAAQWGFVAGLCGVMAAGVIGSSNTAANAEPEAKEWKAIEYVNLNVNQDRSVVLTVVCPYGYQFKQSDSMYKHLFANKDAVVTQTKEKGLPAVRLEMPARPEGQKFTAFDGRIQCHKM